MGNQIQAKDPEALRCGVSASRHTEADTKNARRAGGDDWLRR